MTNGDEIRKTWVLSDTPQNKTPGLFNNNNNSKIAGEDR